MADRDIEAIRNLPIEPMISRAIDDMIRLCPRGGQWDEVVLHLKRAHDACPELPGAQQ